MSVYLFKSNIARHTCAIIVWLDFFLGGFCRCGRQIWQGSGSLQLGTLNRRLSSTFTLTLSTTTVNWINSPACFTTRALYSGVFWSALPCCPAWFYVPNLMHNASSEKKPQTTASCRVQCLPVPLSAVHQWFEQQNQAGEIAQQVECFHTNRRMERA